MSENNSTNIKTSFKNDEKFWKLKIMAFLHDPPNKAFLLSENKSHEDVAKSLIKDLGIDTESDKNLEKLWEIAKRADHIASAEDRWAFSKGTNLNWKNSPVLKHPLSGKDFDIKNLQNFDTKKIEKSIDAVINKIKQDSQNGTNIDYRKLFFNLWRNFNDGLKKQDDGMGALWDLMPAETRMPNHSIWHHNRMVSAIAGSLYNGKNSLVLMTIGPVQDFIRTARTTADFWAGSYLLSYLSWEGMKTFVDEIGPDSILFPDLKSQPIVDKWLEKEFKFDFKIHEGDLSSPSLPNRWLVICPQECAEKLAKEAKENIEKKWEEIKSNCAKLLGIEKEFESLKKQDSFLETYWVVLDLPEENNIEDFKTKYETNFDLDENFKVFLENSNGIYTPNQGTYYSLYISLIERIMGARKAIRIQPQSKEEGYKCTLCGQRETVNIDANTINNKVVINTIKENEKLCSICLTKRIINKTPEKLLGINLEKDFPSVTEIAVADFKFKLAEKCKEDEKLRALVKEFINKVKEINKNGEFKVATLKKVHGIWNPDKDSEKKNILEGLGEFSNIDGILLFEETYDSSELLKNLDKAKKGDIKASLKKIIDKLKIKPTPYLGFIYFDGDKMGDWMSGTHENYPTFEDMIHPQAVNLLSPQNYEKIKNCKLPFMPATQSAISSILLQFSLDVARYIAEQKHIGKLVYAGGDDVVIMAPLSEILKIAKDIRKYFSERGIIFKEGKNKSFKYGTEYSEIISDRNKRKEKTVYFSMGEKATASAGIAIAHYHNSLKDSFNHAAKAEKFAKNNAGRDAFGIALLKRSGEHSIFGAKWNLDSQPISTFENILMPICYMIINDELSIQFINQIYAELDTYFSMREEIKKEIIMARAEYLAKRHIHLPENKKKEAVKKLKECFENLYKVSGELTDKKTEKHLENLKNFLSFCAFYSRHSKIESKNQEKNKEETNAAA